MRWRAAASPPNWRPRCAYPNAPCNARSTTPGTLSTQLPATLTALRSGSLSLQHARVVIDAVTGLDDDPRLRADLDEQLAALAAEHTAATLRRKARTLREHLQDQSIDERHRAARANRRVEIEPARDGMAWLHALLPAADALLIKNRLDQLAREVDRSTRSAAVAQTTTPTGQLDASHPNRHESPAGTAEHDAGHSRHTAPVAALTSDQARADAFRDLLLYGGLGDDFAFAVACGRVRPSVHVTVPVLTLLGTSTEPGLLDGYGPIDPDTARRLAARAPSFARLLTHPVTGTVLDIDRTNYRPPADLKRWLQVRDGTCRFPDCNRNATRSDLDHNLDWHADTGCTNHDNLAHLCPLHHHLKHETSWALRHLPGAILEWTSPTGRVHRTQPAHVMAGRIHHAVEAEARFADAPPF